QDRNPNPRRCPARLAGPPSDWTPSASTCIRPLLAAVKALLGPRQIRFPARVADLQLEPVAGGKLMPPADAPPADGHEPAGANHLAPGRVLPDEGLHVHLGFAIAVLFPVDLLLDAQLVLPIRAEPFARDPPIQVRPARREIDQAPPLLPDRHG